MPVVQAAKASNMQELSALVKGFNGKVSFIAGGTDLIIALQQGARPGLIIDISSMDDLNFIEIDVEEVCIAAATPLSKLAQHRGLAAKRSVQSGHRRPDYRTVAA